MAYNKRDIRKMKRGITLVPTKSTLYRPTKDAETQDRTGDLQIFSLTLSQLSYRGLATGGRLPGANGLCVTTTHHPPSRPRGSTVSFYRHAFIAPLEKKHWDGLAEWSKALASGASPKGRGFEPHSRHFRKS